MLNYDLYAAPEKPKGEETEVYTIREGFTTLVREKPALEVIETFGRKFSRTFFDINALLNYALDKGFSIQKSWKKTATKEQLEIWANETNRRFDRFRIDLFEEYDVSDNPKADLLFSKAWEMGHSSGYSEVENFFSDLVDLIR